MSSCHLLLGRPLDLFPLLGCHSVHRFVHLLSSSLAIWPAHFHFCFSVHSISMIFVLFLISEHGILFNHLFSQWVWAIFTTSFPNAHSVHSYIPQGRHWTFAKITENLRVRAKRAHRQAVNIRLSMRTSLAGCISIKNADWRWPRQRNNPPMLCVVSFYFRQTEQLGKKTENRKRIGGEQTGPKITEKTENNGKSASLVPSINDPGLHSSSTHLLQLIMPEIKDVQLAECS